VKPLTAGLCSLDGHAQRDHPHRHRIATASPVPTPMNVRDTRGVAVKHVADVAVVARGLVLLVRYEDVSRYDAQPGRFLPNEYLGESPDAAAPRILREQAGLELDSTLAEIESLTKAAGI
jgi:hypothetical protein